MSLDVRGPDGKWRMVDHDIEFLSPEAEAKWNAWVAKHKGRRTMGWKALMVLCTSIAIGLLVVILVLPMIVQASH